MNIENQPPFWDKGYSDMTVSTMGGPNHDIVELSKALPPGARVLDLGCGEGRNSFFLAGCGCRVKAVDLSAAGIKKLAALAEQAGLSMETEVGDLNTYTIEGEWDAILCHGVIDYLEKPDWHRVVADMKAHTAPGGVNAYTCMLFTDEFPAPPEFMKAEFKHSVDQFELVGFYDDWTVIRHDRYVKWDQHPGVPIHCHPVDKVVSRRPGGERIEHRCDPVPVGEIDMPRELFDRIDMGLSSSELLEMCGEPAVVDRVTMDGVQVGVGPHCTVDGYTLDLWYYGQVLIYVVNGSVWGRALLTSDPVRVTYFTPTT